MDLHNKAISSGSASLVYQQFPRIAFKHLSCGSCALFVKVEHRTTVARGVTWLHAESFPG